VIQNSSIADFSATSLRIALISSGRIPAFSAIATKCAASSASPTMCRATISSASSARTFVVPPAKVPPATNAAATR
jgi:hypothetical protein